jgi:hypothetical protein
MTPDEINLCIEAYGFNVKEKLKSKIIAAFHGAIFYAKSQKKLSGKDLQDVLDTIDVGEKEMTAEEMLAICKTML